MRPPVPLLAVLLLLLPSLAEAHTGLGTTHGFGHGLAHPLGGLDHVLAMVTVGLLAARIGGPALPWLPAAFLAFMAAGGALGLAGIDLPFVETGIALSVVLLGLAVACRPTLPLALAAGLAGFFALFHGHAHGAEMPADASGLSYAAGFLVATALLHGAGIALGVGIGRLATVGGGSLMRWTGAAVSLGGLAMLARLA